MIAEVEMDDEPELGIRTTTSAAVRRSAEAGRRAACGVVVTERRPAADEPTLDDLARALIAV